MAWRIQYRWSDSYSRLDGKETSKSSDHSVESFSSSLLLVSFTGIAFMEGEANHSMHGNRDTFYGR